MREIIRIPVPQPEPMVSLGSAFPSTAKNEFTYYEIPRKAYEIIRRQARLEAMREIDGILRKRRYREAAEFVEYLRLREESK